MYKKLIVLLLIINGTVFCNAAKISQIEVSGNVNISISDIMAVITSKVGSEMVTDDVIADLDAINRLGFAEVNVDSNKSGKNSVKLVFFVKEYPAIKAIKISGMKVFRLEDLAPSISIRLNEMPKNENIRQSLEAISNYYHERGYVLMQVIDYQMPSDESPTLQIKIKEGEIEDLVIKGNYKTKDYIILRELAMKPGKPFNVNSLRADYSALQNLDFFEAINFNPKPGILDKNKTVVELEVKEKSFGSFNFGGGYSETEKWFGFIDLNANNFLGDGYMIGVKGQWGQTRTTYELKYSNPWQWEDKTSLTARIWRTNGLVDAGQGLNALRTGADAVVGKKLWDKVYGSYTLRTDYVEPENSSINTYLVRMIGGRIAYDTRDVWMNPTTGENYSFGLNSSLKLLGATIEFTKLNIAMSQFYPVMDKLVFAVRGSFDDAYGDIFDTERYFMGGGTTIRGYSDGSPIGIGGRRGMANFELRYSMEAIQLVAFYDIGKITKGSNSCTFDGDNKIRSGKGIGLRVNTPLGPLRFDYAWGDGYTDGSGVIHFNIGHVF